MLCPICYREGNFRIIHQHWCDQHPKNIKTPELPPPPRLKTFAELELEIIQERILVCGNKTQAALSLDISIRTIRNKLNKKSHQV